METSDGLTACRYCKNLHKNITQHESTCGGRLDSFERRVAHVAWRYDGVYSHTAEFEKLGFSDEEIRIGNALGRMELEENAGNRRVYGDPAYGSWPAESIKDQPIRQMIRAMQNGDATAFEAWLSAGVAR